jgi:carbamoyl-phosphate synthase large subunit
VYVLEVNPRASRTIPYVSKATGVPLAKLAARVMAGEKLRDLGLTEELKVRHCFVKSPVFPFNKFPGVDSILGPEMKSTGEVMGVSDSFGSAFAKAQMSAGVRLPRKGTIFISVNDSDKPGVIAIAQDFDDLGFEIIATQGTQQLLLANQIQSGHIFKVGEGRPHVVDFIKSGKIHLLINTPLGRQSHFDEKAIRRASSQHGVPCITTLSGAAAAANALRALQREKLTVRSLQEYHGLVRETATRTR